jgi:hypothetical protein
MPAFVARQATARTSLVPLRIFTPERFTQAVCASRTRSRRHCRTGCRSAAWPARPAAHPGGGEREFQRAESPSEVLVVTGMLTRLPERPITSPMRSGRPSPAGWPTLFPGNTLRVIPRRPESGWEAPGDICYGLARNLTLPQLSGRMSGRGTLVSYLQFSAAADGPVWGNGLCRSQAWTPSIWK